MNLFELAARIELDTSGYDRGVEEATKKGKSLTGSLGKGFSAFSVAAGNLLASGIQKGVSALAGLGKQTVQNFAEYEQLVGGVDTLFKESSSKVQEYASKAFQTAGMSANEYMNTVTGFSASLLQSLDGDTARAAEYADRAITDMSDNANKMGTSMESIQYAYQGFAKQNFTMLDNLKLGYGGTKAEMQRLLDDAEKLSGVKFDISSYADITEAIHIVQTEMGITGTTAKEASETIEGSVNAMKAAWENLAVGFADENADIDQLLDEFIDSVGTVADNILPVIERIMSNISNKLIENMPEIVKRGVELIAKLAAGMVQAIPELLESIPEVIDAIIDGFKAADVDWIDLGKKVIVGIWDGITGMAKWIKEKVEGFFEELFWGVPGEYKRMTVDGKELAVHPMSMAAQQVPYEQSAMGVSSSHFESGSSPYRPFGHERPVEVAVNLDGKTLARGLYDPMKDETNRRGRSFVR